MFFLFYKSQRSSLSQRFSKSFTPLSSTLPLVSRRYFNIQAEDTFTELSSRIRENPFISHDISMYIDEDQIFIVRVIHDLRMYIEKEGREKKKKEQIKKIDRSTYVHR